MILAKMAGVLSQFGKEMPLTTQATHKALLSPDPA